MARSHVIAWRDDLVHRALSGPTIRHRLSALSSLFEHLCEKNAVTHNPVKGVKRPAVESYEGKTPALGDHQARELLEAPQSDSLKGKRDRAILATLLYHALRRDELCRLKVKDFRHERRGVQHLKVSGKGGKTRYVPLHPAASGLITDYLEAAGHGLEDGGALFRPVHHGRIEGASAAITPDGVYKVVRSYSTALGFQIGAHALRATAATNALDHQADIAKVQEWLGHANIATTRLYDRRKTRPEVARLSRSLTRRMSKTYKIRSAFTAELFRPLGTSCPNPVGNMPIRAIRTRESGRPCSNGAVAAYLTV